MDLDTVAAIYKNGLLELDLMVRATESEVVAGTGDVSLFTNNINFFTKSFLISACAHLEMCVKEIIFAVAHDIDTRLSTAAVPTAIIEWRYNSKKKSEPQSASFTRLSVGLTKKEIDDLVSGNVFRTRDALALVGVDLAVNKPAWESWKDLIQAIVTRRNNIVHHNDDASDMSLGDVRSYILSINTYIDYIVGSCKAVS